ncbi:MAG: hypothetical protein ABI672_03325 [Vicinamibacteria bacterium]
MSPRTQRFLRVTSFGLAATVFLGAISKPIIPWEELTEVDWLYTLATRFSLVDAHKVHYKTPTSELAAQLEARPEPEALRHLAQAQMDLGQRDKALATIEKWATSWAATEKEGAGAAWDDAARWAWSYGAYDVAFRFSDNAIKELKGDPQRVLANLRVEWAKEQPAFADSREMQRKALELNSTDWASAYGWVDGDIVSENLAQAEIGLANLPKNTPEEAALVLKARLRAAQLRGADVLPEMDAALVKNPRRGRLFETTYVRVVDQSAKGRPDEWRAALNTRYDAAALTRLFTYFKGQERGDACLALLQQVDRRYQKELDLAGWSLVSSLYAEIDAVPEAFRARLAAATFGEARAGEADLAELTRLALRAGGRPLAWGNYSDADYRWIARMDPTPGFWTGGLSLLLTGQDWSEALSRLEAESVPERTFAAARALTAELAKRNSTYADLPALKVEIMRRHVDRGEGAPAIALLRDVEATGSDAVKQQAQAIGLLALRQTKAALTEETRLYKAQLRYLAPDGSSPVMEDYHYEPTSRFQSGDLKNVDDLANDPETRLRRYKKLFDEAIWRLEERDKTHRSSLALILSEMDRLPNAEPLWLDLAKRLDGWNLDDELGPRYEAAIERFNDPSWWNRMARFLTRQKRQAEIQTLAEKIAATFRGSAIFERATNDDIRIEVPEQPKVGVRARMIPWGDWVVLKALERFPHSPTVLHAAEGRLIAASVWQRMAAKETDPNQHAVVEDSLLAERRWAIFASDAAVRESYFASLMRTDALEAKLASVASAASRTPVDELILAEGYARLSQFEKAADPASRLSATYPGDAYMAEQAFQIHRSLAGLDLSHEAPARAVVDRVVPALQDPHPFITELGELYEETGRPQIALTIWKDLLKRDPRQEARISETATLLWDYGHMKEALDTIEAGRVRANQPRMLAFEAGVLREEVRDIDGAIREYLAAVRPFGQTDSCYCSGFENDQRSLRRLAQWMGRDRVLKRVLGTIDALKPGDATDEKTLLAFWPLGSIQTPTAGVDWDADDWIDAMDQPNDPIGREEREAKRLAARGNEHAGIAKVAQALVAKATAMTPAATNGKFLSSLESSAAAYAAASWTQTAQRDRFFTSIVARQAELAPTIEERLRLEIDLAQRLAAADRLPEADALWKSLATRIAPLPDTAPKIKAEVARVQFIERNAGFDKARVAWDSLIAKYPWSLGVIEDRVAFLSRNGKGVEARQALEDATQRAAQGHDAPLLTRLVTESLAAKDLTRASRALDRLLKTSTLTDEEHLGAVSLQARLRFQQDPAFEAVAFATAEAPKFKPELRPQVFAEVARAASAERSYGTAVTVWIEAINRSTQRDWLKEASRDARKTGKPEVLVSFFEKQQARSPRDVRWAVAARDLRVATDNLPGGIEMAKTAAAIRPERKELWDEGVDLMERDQRYLEAGDFLEGWSVQRPDDPRTAEKRSALYLRGGDLKKAVAVERAALTAYEKSEEKTDQDLAERTADVARRLWRLGQPQLAWRFLAPQERPDQIAASGLSAHEQFQLAILNNAFLPMLTASMDDDDRMSAAANVLNESGRIENREQVLGWLIEKLYPTARADEAFLNKWWSFIENSRLEAPLRFRLAQRFARQINGPWTADAAVDILTDAADVVIAKVPSGKEGETKFAIQAPDLDALWAAHLVRFDRGDELAKYLQPRIASMIELAKGKTPVTADTKRLPWTLWLDSEPAMQTFTRGLRQQPELTASLSSVFEQRVAWDRFWALGARGWNTSPLLAELRPASRVAWLSFWERPVVIVGKATAEDPRLVARRTAVNETSIALSQFLSQPLLMNANANAPTVPTPLDPFAQKLLGPSALGEILATEPRLQWTMFQPRTNAAGDLVETGDDRIVGRGADSLRFPGALWGERPGLAWYALQTYARYRAQDPSAIDVPSEWTESGGETERALLTARLALALKGPAEALAQAERLGLRTSDPELLRFRLKLLIDSGRKADATETLKRRLVGDQKRLDAVTLRMLTVMAEDLDLPAPLGLLDPATPILPALLASLYDQQGIAVGSKFNTADPIGFRAALAATWSSEAANLKAPELRFWLSELWANEAAPLPTAGLNKLGDFWPTAAPWAESLPVNDRARALAAIDALPATTLLEAIPLTTGDSSMRRVVMIRARLAVGQDAEAVALFREGLATLQTEAELTLQPITVSSGSEGEEGDVSFTHPGGFDESEEGARPASNPKASALRALRAPFVATRKAALVDSDAISWLDARIDEEPSDLDFWSLRLDVGVVSQHAEVVDRLKRAYRRGDLATERHGEIAGVLVAHAKELATPWVRGTRNFWFSFMNVERQASRLNALGLKREAAVYIAEARTKHLATRAEELRAFDLWRRYVDASGGGPEVWKQALKFWRDAPETIGAPLLARLKEHSFDTLSARAALRRPTALSPDLALLATRAIHDVEDTGYVDVYADEPFLRMRAARALVDHPRAAQAMGGGLSPDSVVADLSRRRFKASDINAVLADLARIASATDDRVNLRAALDLLADRKWTGVQTLRAEFAAQVIEPPMVSHRVVAGKALLYRPRDLTFAVVSQLVQADLSRRPQAPSPSTSPQPQAQPHDAQPQEARR